MLEDDYTYVLRKALIGHGLSPSEAASKAGLPEEEVLAFSRGAFSPDTAKALAPVLDLDGDAFAAHPGYHPAPLSDPHITRLKLPFGEDHVNAWLIRKDNVSLLFDAGADKNSCLQDLGTLGIDKLNAFFVTHSHPDHIGGLQGLLKKSRVSYGAKDTKGTRNAKLGDIFHFSPLKVKVLDLSGHAENGRAYLVGGLDQPVLVTGDAIFAGSIGGCSGPESYRHALVRLRKVFSKLPDETILLPGHGPATTLGEERANNPFPIRPIPPSEPRPTAP